MSSDDNGIEYNIQYRLVTNEIVHVSMNNSRLKPVFLLVIDIFPALKVVSGLTACEGDNNFVSGNQRKYGQKSLLRS